MLPLTGKIVFQNLRSHSGERRFLERLQNPSEILDALVPRLPE